MTEREVQKAVVKALNSLGWDVTQFSINEQAHSQLRGVVDIYATHEGKKKQIWIEVKASGKKVKPGSAQDRWLARTQASGAHCIVVDSLGSLLRKLDSKGLM